MIPLTTKLLGKNFTTATLGKVLGSHIHVSDIGAIQEDGRRTADQAAYTDSTETMAMHVSQTRRDIALRSHMYERAALRAVDASLAEPIRRSAAQRAKQIKQKQKRELEEALGSLVTEARCKIARRDIPWILAYSQMLKGDEGA